MTIISMLHRSEIVNFLDITLDLTREEFRPYMKPNAEPTYVHADSNHPPGIIKNIPKSINNRISKLSSNKEIFDASKPNYQEALVASGYVMEYDATVVTSASDDHQGRRRNRKRKCIYFNPPYSKTIKTNIGKEFLKIIREEFPKGHPLYSVINKNNIKVSYRCMPNMSQFISSHNRKILKNTVTENVVDVTLTSDDNHSDSDQESQEEANSNNNNTVAVTLVRDDQVTMINDHDEVSWDDATTSSNNNQAAADVTSVHDDTTTNNNNCNCSKTNRSNCPLKGNCLVCCLVYRAKVTRLDNCHCETYTGVTAGTFKCRYYGHCHDMTHRPDEEHKGTTLSNYVWSLKDQNVQHNIDWSVVTRAADFNPATRVCLEEKFHSFMNFFAKVVFFLHF